MLPLIAGAGLLQGALGFFRAKQQQKAAKKAAELNDALARNDTMFSGFNPHLDAGHKSGAVSSEGPSALGAALQGGLSGAMQGVNIYQGLQNLDLAKKKAAQMNGLGVGQSADPQLNAYRDFYANMPERS